MGFFRGPSISHRKGPSGGPPFRGSVQHCLGVQHCIGRVVLCLCCFLTSFVIMGGTLRRDSSSEGPGGRWWGFREATEALYSLLFASLYVCNKPWRLVFSATFCCTRGRISFVVYLCLCLSLSLGMEASRSVVRAGPSVPLHGAEAVCCLGIL